MKKLLYFSQITKITIDILDISILTSIKYFLNSRNICNIYKTFYDLFQEVSLKKTSFCKNNFIDFHSGNMFFF